MPRPWATKDGVLRDYLMGTVMPTVVRTGVEGARRQIRHASQGGVFSGQLSHACLTKSNEVRGQMSEKPASPKKGMQQLSAADSTRQHCCVASKRAMSQ